MKINMKIAAFIKTAREKKNLTQAELGRLVGVTDSAVSRWEKGEVDNIGRSKIAKLAEVLDVDPTEIVHGEFIKKEDYYLNPESARIAQEAYDNPNLRILFDAARDVSPEDLQYVIDLATRLKKEEHPELEDYPDEFPEEEEQVFPED